MVKTVDLEYSSIGSAFMVLIIIVICFGFIYLMCSVFNKGMDYIVPESVKHVYNHFLMPDVDYIIDSSADYLDDSVDYIDGKSDKGPVELVDGSIEQVKEGEPDISGCPTKLMRRGNQIVLLNENEPEVAGKNPIFFDKLDDYVYYMQIQRKQTGKKCPILYLKGEDAKEEAESVPELVVSREDEVSKYFNPPQTPQQLLQSRMPVTTNPYLAYHRPCPLYNTPMHPVANLAMATAPMVQGPISPLRKMVPYADANRQMNPNGTYGFDPSDQYVGKYTVLDQIHDSTKTEYPSGRSANAMDSNWGGALFTSKKLYEGEYIGDEVTKPLPTLTQPASSSTSESANAMDSNWGGKAVSEEAVKEGDFKGDVVTMRTA
tara:strand:- start:730 stop:1854 length:1125 start_codon:yes stop_codon:yes gene_type:complete